MEQSLEGLLDLLFSVVASWAPYPTNIICLRPFSDFDRLAGASLLRNEGALGSVLPGRVHGLDLDELQAFGALCLLPDLGALSEVVPVFGLDV